jgi:hypothetical protein
MDASVYAFAVPAVIVSGRDFPPPPPETADALRQLLDVQREQLAVLKAQAAAQDSAGRWRAFLARWQTDFPDIGAACKQVLPTVERAYLTLMQDLTDRLRDEDADPLDSEFALGEFLDKYGMRLAQLGTVLGQLGPLADAAPAAEPKVDSE